MKSKEIVKTCKHCGEAKPSTEFYTELRNRDKLTARCKACQNQKTKDDRSNPRIRASLLVGAARHRAKAKGMEFSLTLEWALERLLAGVCEATGRKLSLAECHEGALRNLWSPSIDRIDPHRGYVPDNCEMVCTGYNLLKNDCPKEEALRFLSE